jgi:hypothetical protein
MVVTMLPTRFIHGGFTYRRDLSVNDAALLDDSLAASYSWSMSTWKDVRYLSRSGVREVPHGLAFSACHPGGATYRGANPNFMDRTGLHRGVGR